MTSAKHGTDSVHFQKMSPCYLAWYRFSKLLLITNCNGFSEQEKDGGMLGLSGIAGRNIEVSSEDADKDKDFNISDLTNCTVKM